MINKHIIRNEKSIANAIGTPTCNSNVKFNYAPYVRRNWLPIRFKRKILLNGHWDYKFIVDIRQNGKFR